MLTGITLAAIVFGILPQSPPPRPTFNAFEVATIKLAESDTKSGRYIKMQGTNRFIEKDYTLKLLIAAAFELNPKAITGGPDWISSDHFDIQAITPGNRQPTHQEQMAMLQTLLRDRFRLTFHREQKEFSIYAMEVAKAGPKLKASAAPDQPPVLGPAVVHPQHVVLPGRNASTGDLASLLQRAILDRPVVDRTALSGRYDFDLDWAPDESQFGGDVPPASEAAPAAPLFQAIEQELGLKLRATRGPIAALIIDTADRPSAN